MKKTLISFVSIVAMFILVLFMNSSVLATEATITEEKKQGTQQLIEIKENAKNKLEDYVEEYGSESYGLAAYILNIVRLYSIPFCFIGIAIGAIYQYVIGIRKLDERDKGFTMIIGCVSILVLAQVLPLVFAIVVKGWR